MAFFAKPIRRFSSERVKVCVLIVPSAFFVKTLISFVSLSANGLMLVVNSVRKAVVSASYFSGSPSPEISFSKDDSGQLWHSPSPLFHRFRSQSETAKPNKAVHHRTASS